jgi:hypothetical protein
MARKDPQINIRVSEDLKLALHEAANKSGRSVNSEIAIRLEASILYELPSESVFTAKQATLMANKVIDDGYARFLDKCTTTIRAAALSGLKGTVIQSDFEDWGDGDEIDVKIITPVRVTLEKLGYTVEDWELGFYVSF